MQVSIESGEGLEKRLLVDLPADRVAAVMDKKLQDLARHARLDGFRPGKVPMRTIKQRFGEQVRQEAYGTLIQETLY
ncbi:MAG: trigger factor, partial [Chromatiales bacterium]|nr:trigger factor [Chromatiales bacterium]